MKSLLFCLLLSLNVFAQNTPTKSADSKPAPIDVTSHYIDSADPAIWLRASLPPVRPNSRKHYLGQVQLQQEGWLYYVSEVDHHSLDAKNLLIAVTNPDRSDALCRGREEMIIQFGEGRPWWPRLSEYGYHVRKGDRLKLDIKFDNPKSTEIHDGNITIVFLFQPIDSGAFRRDVYPLWFDTKGCGPSEYDLKPGKNIASGSFEMSLDGSLVALQGSLRDLGQQLVVENATRGQELLNTSINPMPTAKPATSADWHLAQGDMVSISATYDNPEKHDLKMAATGIALGLFVPTDPAAVDSLDKHKVEDARPRASQ